MDLSDYDDIIKSLAAILAHQDILNRRMEETQQDVKSLLQHQSATNAQQVAINAQQAVVNTQNTTLIMRIVRTLDRIDEKLDRIWPTA